MRYIGFGLTLAFIGAFLLALWGLHPTEFEAHLATIDKSDYCWGAIFLIAAIFTFWRHE